MQHSHIFDDVVYVWTSVFVYLRLGLHPLDWSGWVYKGPRQQDLDKFWQFLQGSGGTMAPG